MADNDPNVQRRRLRTALRKHREDADFTQREAVAALEWSPSKLIRIEAGNQGVSVTDLRALLQLYGVTDQDTIATLTTIARATRSKPWWHEYRDIVSPQFAEYLGYESSASSLRTFHPFLLPGLLHTEAYATELLDVLGDPERTRRIVKLRTKRQMQLFADPALSIEFILNEEALYRWISGRQAIQRQLQHVRDVGQRPNVTLKIVPFSAGVHPGLCGPFTTVCIEDVGEQLVFLEGISGDQLIKDDSTHVRRYDRYAAELNRLALTPEDSDALLKEQIGRLQLASSSGTGYRSAALGTATYVGQSEGHDSASGIDPTDEAAPRIERESQHRARAICGIAD